MWKSEDEDNLAEPETQPFSKGIDFDNRRVLAFAHNVTNGNIRSPNKKQRQVFNTAYKSSKDYLKNINSRLSKFLTNLIFFLLGEQELENYILLKESAYN